MKDILKKGRLVFSILVIYFLSLEYKKVFAQESFNLPEKVLSLKSLALVEHSVWNRNYSERNGKFANVIKTTKTYRRMIKNGCDANSFGKRKHRDLYYAIHKFSYTCSGNSQEMRIRIHDNLFTSIVNSWVYLHQNMHVLCSDSSLWMCRV